MSTAALALLAAVAAVVVAGLVATIVLRSRRASEQRLDAGLLVIGERMDALADELATTVERMREDALRTRLVESLGQALDLDEVLARCAEAAAALHGVAGATVAVLVDGVAALGRRRPRGRRGRSSRGAGAVGGPPDGSRVRAVGISYHYPVEGAGETAIRSAIAIPLENGHGQLGFLTVFGFSEDPPVTGSDFQAAGGDRRHTAAAIEVARLRRDARRRRWRRRPADRARQPPGAPRDAGARGRPGPPARPPAGGLQLRHRRLQADERPDREPRGRRDPRRGRGGAPRDAPSRRPRLPQRRGRVRRDPAGCRPDRGRGASTRASRARCDAGPTPPLLPSASRPASPS